MRGNWSDERLMLAYREGDVEAFTWLYRRYRGSLFRYLSHQCGNAEQAADLFQDVWIKVINARLDYEPLARFSTWIFRIARHRLIDHHRRQAPHQALNLHYDEADQDGRENAPVLPASADQTPSALFERRNVAERIQRALADLPAAQREVFLLAEESGLTLEEIAEATGTGRETVKSRMRYALGKLRHALQDLL